MGRDDLDMHPHTLAPGPLLEPPAGILVKRRKQLDSAPATHPVGFDSGQVPTSMTSEPVADAR